MRQPVMAIVVQPCWAFPFPFALIFGKVSSKKELNPLI
jgi:hypothetical protein